MGTALRPAFADNIPPDVTAMACEVSTLRVQIFAELIFVIWEQIFKFRETRKIDSVKNS